MAAILSTVTVLALLSATASSAPPPTSPPTTTPPPEEDTYLFVPRQIQLAAFPRPSAAFVPSEPLSVLTPPLEESPAADFYGVPVPAQELLAPTETGWNPQDDPRMYYEVVETPTRAFPKKYLAEEHSKGKPYSSRPKQEVVLVEVEEEVPRKALEKKYLDEAKRRNRAELEQVAKRRREEPVAAGSGYEEGLGEDVTASLGIPRSQAGGERLVFHVVGHDGPKSYKWGYDTGKGHDRMFRFEERDKTGLVKGHYGFYDKSGKLQVVHYDAHPHTGFHSDADGSTI